MCLRGIRLEEQIAACSTAAVPSWEPRMLWDAPGSLHTTAGCLVVHSEHRKNNNVVIFWAAKLSDSQIVLTGLSLKILSALLLWYSWVLQYCWSKELKTPESETNCLIPHSVHNRPSLNWVPVLFVFKPSFCLSFSLAQGSGGMTIPGGV